MLLNFTGIIGESVPESCWAGPGGKVLSRFVSGILSGMQVGKTFEGLFQGALVLEWREVDYMSF